MNKKKGKHNKRKRQISKKIKIRSTRWTKLSTRRVNVSRARTPTKPQDSEQGQKNKEWKKEENL